MLNRYSFQHFEGTVNDGNKQITSESFAGVRHLASFN